MVAFDVDNRGRVFVCESFRQNQGVTDNRKHDETWLLADLAAETVQDRIDYHKTLTGRTMLSPIPDKMTGFVAWKILIVMAGQTSPPL